MNIEEIKIKIENEVLGIMLVSIFIGMPFGIFLNIPNLGVIMFLCLFSILLMRIYSWNKTIQKGLIDGEKK